MVGWGATGEKRVRLWKEKILAVVGANGRLLTELLPELERVIGTQPQINSSSITETNNRFAHVFNQFVRLFCRFVFVFLLLLLQQRILNGKLTIWRVANKKKKNSEEHPLVLFLDDLQWADCTSLKLIPLIVSGDVRFVFCILSPTCMPFINNGASFHQQAHAVGGSVQK